METIKVRASLKPATIADIFHGRDTLMNKLLFVKCPKNGNFIGRYTIPELDNGNHPYHTYRELIEIEDRNKFYRQELTLGITAKLFYVLSDNHNDNFFQFKLILRTADLFDLFDGENYTKANAVYYVKVNEHEVTGPHYMLKNPDINHVKETMKLGKLFVPAAKQTFEPYKIAQAS